MYFPQAKKGAFGRTVLQAWTARRKYRLLMQRLAVAELLMLNKKHIQCELQWF